MKPTVPMPNRPLVSWRDILMFYGDPGGSYGDVDDGAVRIARLGANLAAGGAVCASFTLGMKASKDLYWHGRAWWSPGCGKDAAPYLEKR